MAKIRIEPIPGIENPKSSDIRMLIDGQEVKDLAGYAIEHDAASAMPIVVVRIATSEPIDVDLPEAQVIERGPIERDEPPDPPRARQVLGPALSVLAQADSDLRQGIDITLLATRYCSLGVRQRFTCMQILGLLSAEEYSKGMTFAPAADALDREAITRAIAQGKLKEFAEAIADACDTYRICTHGGDFNTCEICLTEWARAEMAARAKSGRGGIEPGSGLSVLVPPRPIAAITSIHGE